MSIKKKTRNEKSTVWIFCSGEKAEPQYFQDFKHFLSNNDTNLLIKIKNKKLQNKSPSQLMEAAIKHKESKDVDIGIDKIWCVFDIDDYLKGAKNTLNFEESLKKAKQNQINLAWSNECFELWFLMHFQTLDNQIPRKDYDKKLKKFLKRENIDYSKNMKNIFSILLKKQSTAIKNSKLLFENNKEPTNNPSTLVFQLVEMLIKSIE